MALSQPLRPLSEEARTAALAAQVAEMEAVLLSMEDQSTALQQCQLDLEAANERRSACEVTKRQQNEALVEAERSSKEMRERIDVLERLTQSQKTQNAEIAKELANRSAAALQATFSSFTKDERLHRMGLQLSESESRLTALHSLLCQTSHSPSSSSESRTCSTKADGRTADGREPTTTNRAEHELQEERDVCNSLRQALMVLQQPSPERSLHELVVTDELEQCRLRLEESALSTSKLNSELAMTKSRLVETTELCSHLNNECATLQAAMEQQQRLHEELNALRCQVASLTGELNSLHAVEARQLEDLQTASTMVEQLQARNRDLVCKSTECNMAELEKVRHELAMACATNEVLQERLHLMEGSTVPKSVHENKLALVKAQLHDRDQTIDIMQSRLSGAEENSNRLSREVEGLVKQLDSLKQRQGEEWQSRAQLTLQCADDFCVEDYREKDALRRAATKLDEAAHEIERLEAENGALARRVAAMERCDRARSNDSSAAGVRRF